MINKLAVLALFLFIQSINGNTQNPGDEQHMKDRLESSRIAFITNRLNLTPEEAQLFWPVHNEYESKMKEVRGDHKKMSSQDLMVLTDEEATQLLENMIEKDKNAFQLKQDYLMKMQSVLPTRKVAVLYMIDGDFKRELVRQMKKRKPERRNK